MWRPPLARFNWMAFFSTLLCVKVGCIKMLKGIRENMGYRESIAVDTSAKYFQLKILLFRSPYVCSADCCEICIRKPFILFIFFCSNMFAICVYLMLKCLWKHVYVCMLISPAPPFPLNSHCFLFFIKGWWSPFLLRAAFFLSYVLVEYE